MKHSCEWTAADWFRAAMDCYVVDHQGCPCCREQHCVFRTLWSRRVEYYCSACEFSVCLDGVTGECHHVAGDKERAQTSVLDVGS